MGDIRRFGNGNHSPDCCDCSARLPRETRRTGRWPPGCLVQSGSDSRATDPDTPRETPLRCSARCVQHPTSSLRAHVTSQNHAPRMSRQHNCTAATFQVFKYAALAPASPSVMRHGTLKPPSRRSDSHAAGGLMVTLHQVLAMRVDARSTQVPSRVSKTGSACSTEPATSQAAGALNAAV